MEKSITNTIHYPDMHNVQIAADALQLLVANLSRESEHEFVGQGYLSQHLERIGQGKERSEKRKKNCLDAYDKLVIQLQHRLSELQNELTELQIQEKALRSQLGEIEAAMGGIDAMGAALGMGRQTEETDQHFRKRLKFEIDRKLNQGELDLYSPFAQWSTHYDYLEDNLLAQAQVQQGVDQIETALQSRNEEHLVRTLSQVSPDALRSVELEDVQAVHDILAQSMVDADQSTETNTIDDADKLAAFDNFSLGLKL